MTVNFSIANNLGFNFTQTYLPPYDQTAAISATNDPSNPSLPCAVGTHALGTNGTEYVFCLCGASALVANQWVGIVPVTFSTVPGSLAIAVAQSHQLGLAQTACAVGSYCWVAIRGMSLQVLAKLGSLANAKVYPSTSNGRVSTTSVHTSGPLTGLILTQSSTSARLTTGVTCYASWPRLLV